MSKSPFVKAATTTVSPAKSRLEIETMLRRYGAVGFSFSQNIETGESVVEFIVPDSRAKGAPKIPVRIPVNAWDVYDALVGRPTVTRPGTGLYVGEGEARRFVHAEYDLAPRPYKDFDAKKYEQAERVAWRNMVLWIDAALSAATIGLRTIAQTFAADRLVTDDENRTMRAEELFERSGGVLPNGARLLLLAAPTP